MSVPADLQRIVILHGDCVARMKEMADNSIDAVICDPPYFLGFMGKEFDIQGDASSDPKAMQETHRSWLTEAFRILKPDGIIKAMSGSRTWHRLGAAMKAVGFVDISKEEWCYASGFPKSLNVSKAFDKKLGVEQETVGVRTDGRGRSRQKIDNHGPGDTGIGHADGSQQTYEETKPTSEEARKWDGYGTSLKPAHEPILLGRKPPKPGNRGDEMLFDITG